MAAQNLSCIKCSAPLVNVPPEGGALKCGYCGAPNVVELGRGKLRSVVREVLSEDHNNDGIPDHLQQRIVPVNAAIPQSWRSSSATWIAFGSLVGVTMIGGIASFVALRTQANAVAPPTAERAPLAPPVAVAAVPADPLGNDNETFEKITPVAMPSGSSAAVQLVVLRGKTLALIAIDPSSAAPRFELKWRTEVSSFDFDNDAKFLIAGTVLVAGGRRSVSFFDLASGKANGNFVLAGIGMDNICLSKEGAVLVKQRMGAVIAIDPTTQQKTKASGKCLDSPEVLCAATEKCGWKVKTYGDLYCRYSLRIDAAEIQTCTADDGSGKAEIVAISKNESTWRTKLASSSDSVEMLSRSGDLIIAGFRGELRAFQVNDGSERWKQQISGEAMALIGDRYLAVGINGRLSLIDKSDGKVVTKL